MTGTGRTSRAIAAAIGTFAFAGALALGPTALAQTASTIEGTVTNGTEQAPAAEVPVSIQLFSATGDLGVLETTSDAKGRFVFAELPTGVAGYQVFAEYGGAEYRGIAQAYTPGTPTNAALTVYEPTNDPADVTYTNYVVWIDEPEQGGFAFQHGLAFANAGTTAYAGDGESVVTIEMPPDATNPQFLDTFLEHPGEIVDDTYVSDAPIVPGESAGTLRYETASLPPLSVLLEFPATSFQLYVPEGIEVDATILRFEGTISDQGRTYSVYSAANLAPDTTIEGTLTAAPADDSQSLAIQILLGIAAVFAAGIIVAWLVRRRRTARAPKRPAKAVAKASAKATPTPKAADVSGNGHRVEGSDEDVDLIIDEIAALDLSFEKGLLDEQRYTRLRVAAKDRLLRAQGSRTGGRAR